MGEASRYKEDGGTAQMPKARNPVTVINAILAQIPSGIDHNALRINLEEIRDHPHPYIATEDPRPKESVWEMMTDRLEQNLHNPPKEEWEKAIDSIMRGRKPDVKR